MASAADQVVSDRADDRADDQANDQANDHEVLGGTGEVRHDGYSGDMAQVAGSAALENDKMGRTQSSGPIHIEADSCVDQGGERQVAGNSGQVAENSGPGAEGGYPAAATYGAWMNVMNVPPGMAGATQGMHGVGPYMSHGLPGTEMYPVNVPSGYAGQAFAMPAMMYMPMPHIAPRLAPPFIDRHKSGSSGRGTSRSPRAGGHTEARPEEVHASDGRRDPLEDQPAHRIHGLDHAERQASFGDQGSDDKARFSLDAGQAGPSAQVGRPSQSSTRVSSHQKPCAFFLQHGSCAFGSKCKFSHPIELAPVVEYNSVGLPRRYGQPVCRYYVQTGRCSYGYTCRYDHPDFAG